MLDLKLENTIQKRVNTSLLRLHQPIQSTDGVYVTIDNQQYLSFSSNNYLGLSSHPKIIAAGQAAFERLGVGSGAAYLVSGYNAIQQELEEQLAAFLNYPRVLLFSSGYLANMGVISALFSKNDDIFADKLNHASLTDGAINSQANFKRYPHCQIVKLKSLLEVSSAPSKLIVTEGLFGMDGSIAPLLQLSQCALQHRALLLVDDAHGIGVLGKNGRGTLELLEVGYKEVPILIGTLGKAFGTYGAFVASSSLIIESLLQLARPYIYTTALPPAIFAASQAGLTVMIEESWRRHKLFELITYFKEGARQLDLPCLNSDSPIQLIIIGDNQKSLDISQALFSKGIFVKAIRPPTVPTARLRITITALHTKNDIDFLLENLTNAIKTS